MVGPERHQPFHERRVGGDAVAEHGALFGCQNGPESAPRLRDRGPVLSASGFLLRAGDGDHVLAGGK